MPEDNEIKPRLITPADPRETALDLTLNVPASLTDREYRARGKLMSEAMAQAIAIAKHVPVDESASDEEKEKAYRAHASAIAAQISGRHDYTGAMWTQDRKGFKSGKDYFLHMRNLVLNGPAEGLSDNYKAFMAADYDGQVRMALEAETAKEKAIRVGGELLSAAWDAGNTQPLTREEEADAPEEVRAASAILAVRDMGGTKQDAAKVEAANATVGQYREKLRREEIRAKYEQQLNRENAWHFLTSILPTLSEGGQEVARALLESRDNKLPDTMYAAFKNLDEREQEIIARTRWLMKPEVESGFWNTLGDAGIGFANVGLNVATAPLRQGGKAGNMIANATYDAGIDINRISRTRQLLYQASGDFFAGGSLEAGALPQMQFENFCDNHGIISSALIGAVSTLPYMAAAGIPHGGTALVALEAMQQFDDYTALNGGDITDGRYLTSSLLLGGLYAYIEKLQFEGLLGGIGETKLRVALLKGLFTAQGSIAAGRTIFAEWLSESLQEGLQNGVMAVNEALALDGDPVRAFGEGVTEDFINSLGTMLVVSAGGVVVGHMGRSGWHLRGNTNAAAAQLRQAARSADLSAFTRGAMAEREMLDTHARSYEWQAAAAAQEGAELYGMWAKGGAEALVSQGGLTREKASGLDVLFTALRESEGVRTAGAEAAAGFMAGKDDTARETLDQLAERLQNGDIEPESFLEALKIHGFSEQGAKDYSAMLEANRKLGDELSSYQEWLFSRAARRATEPLTEAERQRNYAKVQAAMRDLAPIRAIWARGAGVKTGDQLDAGAAALEQAGFAPEDAARLSKLFHTERANAMSPNTLRGVRALYEATVGDKLSPVAALTRFFGGRMEKLPVGEDAQGRPLYGHFLRFGRKGKPDALVRVAEMESRKVDASDASDAMATSVEEATGGIVSAQAWRAATPEQRSAWVDEYGLATQGSFRLFSPQDPSVRITSDGAGEILGEISVARNSVFERAPGEFAEIGTASVYHEVFHAFARFMQESGIWTEADIAALQKRFGKGQPGELFNEERAAEEFREYMTRRFVGAMTEADEKDGVFRKLWRLVRGVKDTADARAAKARVAENAIEAFFDQIVADRFTGLGDLNEESKPKAKSKADENKAGGEKTVQSGTVEKQGENAAVDENKEGGEKVVQRPGAAATGWSAATPTGNVRVSGHWAIYRLEDLIHSNHPLYARHMRNQLRNRVDNKAEEDARENIIKNFDAARLFESPDTANGAPIVFIDVDEAGKAHPFVLSGNGRVMVLNALAERHLFDRYRTPMRDWAKENGLDVPDGDFVAVRVIDDFGGATREQVADLSNTNSIQQYTEEEQARADAEVIKSLGLAQLYRPNQDGTPDMTPGANDEFFGRFIQGVGDTSLYNADRTLTETARARVMRALLAISVGQGERGRETVKMLIDRSDTLGINRQKNALAVMASAVAALEGNPDYAIGPDVSRAVADFLDFMENKETGKKWHTIENYLRQDYLIDPPSEIARDLCGLLGSRQGALDIAEYVQTYCTAAKDEDPSGGLFGEAMARTRTDIWRDAKRAVEERRAKENIAKQTRFAITKVHPVVIDIMKQFAAGLNSVTINNAEHGAIEFPLGKQGTLTETGKVKHGLGLMHIVYSRMAKDGDTLENAVKVAFHVADAAYRGDTARNIVNRLWLDREGVRAIIAKNVDGKKIISGYKISAAEEGYTPDMEARSATSNFTIRSEEVLAALRHIISQFSSESQAENDRKYLDAVRRGNMETAQKMVREAAKKNGYKVDTDPVTYDDAGNVIPLSQRFSPARDKGRYSIIGRRGAERLGVGKLDSAEAMETAGKDREEIWRKTGWWRGVDGKWRFEIPNAQAFNIKAVSDWVAELNRNGGKDADWRTVRTLPLKEVLQDKHLFKAYPELDELKIAMRSDFSDGVLASLSKPYIFLSPIMIEQGPNNFLPYILHEVQHAIQDLEPMAKGGNEAIVQRARKDDANVRKYINEEAKNRGFSEWFRKLVDGKQMKQTYDEAKERFANSEFPLFRMFAESLDETSRNSFVRDLDFADKNFKGNHQLAAYGTTTFEAYKRFAGEVEARNVEKRLAMTPEERAAIPPWETEDIDASEQIVRYSIGGLFTGSAADYDQPSLVKVGTGEGNQVYGWGLYASNVRGVGESYATYRDSDHAIIVVDGKEWKPDANAPIGERTAYEQLDDFANSVEEIAEYCESREEQRYKDAAKFIRSHKIEIREPHTYLYEQTFFTNRAPGDESHLLKWYEPVSEEQKQWIADEINKSIDDPKMKYVVTENGFRQNLMEYKVKTGKDAYQFATIKAAVIADSQNASEYPRLASELLARAGIDGVKYPVDSYGKPIKDGDKAGWNYVSFRDDNIRVDHKWVDGQQRFSIISVGGYGGRLRALAHGLKEGDREAIKESAGRMAEILPDNAVLVPIPSHTGRATTMLALANAIHDILPGTTVVDALEADPHESNYVQKRRLHRPPDAVSMRGREGVEIPAGRPIYFIDNVVASGATYAAAQKAIPGADIATLTDTRRQKIHPIPTQAELDAAAVQKKAQLYAFRSRYERERTPQMFTQYTRAFMEYADAVDAAYTSRHWNEEENSRFSLSSAVERRKDLIAMHNVSADGLRGMDELDGLAMPSFAITKDSMGNAEFGEISLLVKPATINPRRKGNAIYTNDAWTPTFPETRVKIDADAADRIYERGREIFTKDPEWEAISRLGFSGLSLLNNLDPGNLDDFVNRNDGDVMAALKNKDAYKILFLLDTGRAPKIEKTNAEIFSSGRGLFAPKGVVAWIHNPAVAALSDKLGDKLLPGGKPLTDEEAGALAKDMELAKEVVAVIANTRSEERRGLIKNHLLSVLDKNPMRPVDFYDISVAIAKYRREGIPEVIDTAKTMQAVDEATQAHAAEYEAWLKRFTQGLTDGKRYVRNERDRFTPSGNRRPFEQLWDPLTLATAVKAMLKQQNEQGGGFLGLHPFGVAARKYKDLSEVIKDENRLKTLTKEEKEKLKEALNNKFLAVVDKYNKTKKDPDDNPYIQFDRASDMMLESYKIARGNKARLLAELNGYGYTASEELVDEFLEVMHEMSSMPEDYFEAKAYRAVGFDEIAAAVIPDNASAEAKEILARREVPVYEYKVDDKADRLRAVNEAADVTGTRFSVSSTRPAARSYEDIARRSVSATLADPNATREQERALVNYVAYFKLAHGPTPTAKTIARLGLSIGMKTVSPKRILDDAEALAEQTRGTIVEQAAQNGDAATAMALMHHQKQTDDAIARMIAGGASAGGAMTHKGVGQINSLLQRRVEQMMRSFTAATLAEMEGETGLDLAAEILANNPDAFADEIKKSRGAQEQDSGETADDGADDASGGDDAGLSDYERHRRETARQEALVKVEKFIADAKERAAERKRAAEERSRRAQENANFEDGAGGGEGGEGGNAAASRSDESPKNVLANFKTKEEFAAFVRVWAADRFKREHGLSTLAQAEQDRLFAEFYRITARQELSDLADKLLAPRGARAHVNRRLQDLEKGVKPDTVERISASLFAFINSAAIRESRVELVKKFKRELKAYWQGNQFDQFKQDTDRRVTGWVEESARYIARVCDLSVREINGNPSQLAEERRRLQEIIDRRTKVYDESGKEVSVAALEDMETRRAYAKMALLEKYGAMTSLMPGQILDLAESAKQYLAEEAGKLEELWRETRDREDRIRVALARAIQGPNGQKYEEKGWLNGRLFDALNGLLRLRLQHLTRFASDDLRSEAKDAIDEILVLLGDGETRYARAQQDDRAAFFEGLAQIFRKADGSADNAAIRQYLNRMTEKIPAELARRISNQGYADTMTYGQMLQLLVSIEQRSYAESVRLNGREDHAALIRSFETVDASGRRERVLTSADIRFIDWLRAFYAAKRETLSPVMMRMVGQEIVSPDPLYCPVRMSMDDRVRGLHSDPSRRWDPISAVMSRRVDTTRDFDESASIVGMFFDRSNESAKLLAWAERGSFIRAVFTSQQVQTAIRRAFGSKELSTILKQLEATFNGGESRRRSPGELAAIDKAMNFITYAYLGFNPLSAAKQTTSFTVWANVLPGGFTDLWRHMTHFDKAALKHLMESEEYKVRYGEGSGSGQNLATRGLYENPGLNPVSRFFTGAGMKMLKWGDFAPGGWIAQGLYKDLLDKNLKSGMEFEAADKRAITETFNLLEESQQSGRTYNTNMFSIEHGRIGRLLTQFATSPLQQLQYETQAWREWRDMVRYNMGEARIAAARQKFWRAALINHLLLPAALNFVTAIFKAAMGDEPPWEKDGWHWTLLIEVLLGQYSRVFFIGAMAQTTLAALLKRETPRSVGILPVEGMLGIGTSVGILAHDILTLDAERVRKDLDRAMKSTAPTRTPYKLLRRALGE